MAISPANKILLALGALVAAGAFGLNSMLNRVEDDLDGFMKRLDANTSAMQRSTNLTAAHLAYAFGKKIVSENKVDMILEYKDPEKSVDTFEIDFENQTMTVRETSATKPLHETARHAFTDFDADEREKLYRIGCTVAAEQQNTTFIKRHCTPAAVM